MRQKRSEKPIIEESGSRGRGRGISSGLSTVHQEHLQEQIQIQSQLSPQTQQQKSIQTLTHLQILPTSPNTPPDSPPPPPPPTPTATLLTHHQPHFHFHYDQPIFSNRPSTTQKPILSSPHKRPSIMTLSPPSSSFSHSSTLPSLRSHHYSNLCVKSKVNGNPFKCIISIKTLAYKLFSHLSNACLLFVQLRVLVLIFLPSLYFLLSNPHRFFILNLISVLVFSITLIVSLNFALPRLPSVRLFLARSLPNNLKTPPLPTNASKPVIWSIGSKPKVEKKLNSGSWVQVYSNGDVYEGEFHEGKCSGSGVYYYYMSGRYEGEWINEKYDGYGVETWARGSRYRGQYRQGLRHGIGVYRFYTGEVYAGEWSNGQCHGCGIHTCEDGSRYVGEFKWGVKHGLGHYHFR